ncbi:hypothetical protein [Moraxella sp.]|uniref:hypothetical protein n=1 Tax=Moraxella sp. TaxID=479 RepID=UPI00260F58C7|nr:hypothetical protein [Moraxella sp.]MCP3897979.1 hypothetical protein [Moraxella sp.]
MKTLKVVAVCTLLAMSSQSFANAVPIKFAKGSYCGSFSGNFKGKTFTMQLGGNQTLEIKGLYLIDPTVKDPKGRTLKVANWEGEDEVYYNTTTKGKYTIALRPMDNSGYYGDIQFCAY